MKARVRTSHFPSRRVQTSREMDVHEDPKDRDTDPNREKGPAGVEEPDTDSDPGEEIEEKGEPFDGNFA